MPTLMRFLMTLFILGVIAVGTMVALIMMVEPTERDMSSRVSVDQLLKDRSEAPVE